jgi:integrase
LWTSGLRLGESLELFWDRDDKLCVDLTTKRPTLRIPAELEKGNRDRLLPIAPEFAEFLLMTPDADRTGPVFRPAPERVKGERLCDYTVSRILSKIGEKAGVKVATGQNGKVKYASAHDLRRSFGERWAARVMPVVLQQLMRHESIETTLRYYVGRNAQSTADVLWEAHERAAGNTLGNSAHHETTQESRKPR